jgi:hypothetical protein
MPGWAPACSLCDVWCIPAATVSVACSLHRPVLGGPPCLTAGSHHSIVVGMGCCSAGGVCWRLGHGLCCSRTQQVKAPSGCVDCMQSGWYMQLQQLLVQPAAQLCGDTPAGLKQQQQQHQQRQAEALGVAWSPWCTHVCLRPWPSTWSCALEGAQQHPDTAAAAVLSTGT